jgi:cytochrome P450
MMAFGGTLALLRNPDQLAIVRDTDDPNRLASAIDELLRYLSIPHYGAVAWLQRTSRSAAS